jgi:hypothetical protein
LGSPAAALALFPGFGTRKTTFSGGRAFAAGAAAVSLAGGALATAFPPLAISTGLGTAFAAAADTRPSPPCPGEEAAESRDLDASAAETEALWS